jgi:hypothetical protein
MGKYIVKMRASDEYPSLSDAVGLVNAHNAEYVFNSSFSGFASTMDAASLDAVRYHPNVSRRTAGEALFPQKDI